jgi:hypothetical protein
MDIDFSAGALPLPDNALVWQETRSACAEMARQERDFVAGALATSGLAVEQWPQRRKSIARACWRNSTPR